MASDLNDSVVRVDFYANNQYLGSGSSAPFEVTWIPAPGFYTISAVGFDTFGDSTVSNKNQVTILPAPWCEGTSWNGDFSYRFTPDQNNPTITFIPSKSGVGSPTCILYYGTDPGNMPGYGVTPNVPFQINASKGTRIYFYYTYSYPGAGERNNSANKDSYVIGTCKNLSAPVVGTIPGLKVYPNPARDIITLEMDDINVNVDVFDLAGKQLDHFITRLEKLDYNMSEYPSGTYVIRFEKGGRFSYIKVIRE